MLLVLFFMTGWAAPAAVLAQSTPAAVPAALAAPASAVVAAATPAAEPAAPAISAGDTAWVLASAALVLLMTPGLAFFYAGMVRRKNVMATIMQSFFMVALISIQWVIWGYSLAFSPGNGFIGGLKWLFLDNIGAVNPAAPTIPHYAFMIFQAMFAIITPGLILGAFAERMKFAPFCFFSLMWATFV